MPRWSFVILVVAAILSGCQYPFGKSKVPADLVQQIDTTAATKPVELSAKEAAEACKITAVELAKHGFETDAIAELEHARSLHPRTKSVSRHLAVLYDRAGKSSEAKREYEVALKEQPKDPDLLNDYGYFFAEQNDWVEAEKQYRKALGLAPQHQRASVNLGLAVAQQGRYDESRRIFSAVVGESAAWSNVGMVMAQRNDLEEAKSAFEKAAELEPTLAIPQAALSQLESSQKESVARVHFEND
ncbi:MAG: repeat-containing protein [Schlesneria sp.]|nr:repeat-containing protein [Schlesneria sp.]